MGRCLLPMLYHLADVIAFFNVIVVGKTLHHMYGLKMADVNAKWQDGTATFLCFEVGRCYPHVAGWNSHISVVKWQMFLPGGRRYSQVADGITTHSG